MGVILEIEAGPFARQKIPVRFGQSLLIGRATGRAEFTVPHDSKMSGVHFAVECGMKGNRVIDKGSTNGTYLNGAKIKEEMLLANGDEIKSGQTIFVVRIVPDNSLPAIPSSPNAIVQPSAAAPGETPRADSPPVRQAVASIPTPQSRLGQLPSVPSAEAPRPGKASAQAPSQPPALAIGNWAFHKIPDGWKIQEGLGLQQIIKDAFPSSIVVMEEPLSPGITLAHFVEAHTKMFRENLREPKIDIAAPPAIRGAVETVALEVRFSTKEGPPVYFHRVYSQSGSILGVLTLTALEKDLLSVRPSYDYVLSDISFSAKD